MDHYTPCLLPKILRSRCFLFLLVDCATQEELETLVRQTFFLEGYGEAGVRGGEGQTRVAYHLQRGSGKSGQKVNGA